MEFREQYPVRVTVGADGIYRWSADVDLKKDHYVQNLTMKIMFFICGGICLMTLIFAANCCWVIFLSSRSRRIIAPVTY